jgi:hypothetical protein
MALYISPFTVSKPSMSDQEQHTRDKVDTSTKTCPACRAWPLRVTTMLDPRIQMLDGDIAEEEREAVAGGTGRAGGGIVAGGIVTRQRPAVSVYPQNELDPSGKTLAE